MTPLELESLIDHHGAAPERWPEAQRAATRRLLATSEAARTVLKRAERLEALLRDADRGGDAVDSDHVQRIIARTRAAAHRTPQRPPSLLSRLWRGCARGFAVPQDGLWRYGVPAAVGLVLGVLVGHASVDQVAFTDAEVAPNVESLINASQSAEPFGL